MLIKFVKRDSRDHYNLSILNQVLTVMFFFILVETEESVVQQYQNPEWRHDH